jgi:ATP-binding cassette, subfamily C, bacterial CydC
VTTFRRLLSLLGAPRRRVAAAALLGTGTVLCGVGLMATAGYLISRAAQHPDVLALGVAIVGVRFFGLARPLCRYLERLVSHDLAFRVLGGARTRVYRRLEPLAPAQLEGYRDGDLLSRLIADVDGLQNLYLRGLGPVLVALLAGAASVTAAALVLPTAAVVLAGGLALAAVLGPLAELAHETAPAAPRGAVAADVVELLRGAPELVVNGGCADRLGRLLDNDRALVERERRAAFADGAGDALRLAVTGATTAGVLAVAIAAHDHGRVDGVLIAMLGLLVLAAFEAVQPLPQAARELRETLGGGSRLLEILDREPAVADPAEPEGLPAAPPAIELQDVVVGHAPGLAGFDLRLEPGRKVALVGPSGVGKTTVANLLLRFRDPDAGRVLLGGRDLRRLRQAEVRRTIAVVDQDAHLFSASIRDNLLLARPDADDDALEDALRRARVLETVRRLPDGLDTLVGEEGKALSGGERQRLAIARGLLAGSPVLVLDEPTAHLDGPTAERLLDDVLGAVGDGTLLLITHRSERLERMDEVVALG